MTKEEILKMEAGDRLDNLVIKELMHHDWDDGDRPRCKVCGVWENWPKPAGCCENRKYSTDISTAWLVVEKMRKMEDSEGNQLLCCLKIHCDIPGDVWNIHWSYAELSNMDDGHKDHKLPLSWYSLPEAISKAALLIKLETNAISKN